MDTIGAEIQFWPVNLEYLFWFFNEVVVFAHVALIIGMA